MEDQVSSTTSDRRARARQRVLLSGKLAYADHSITADCSIRNLSERGAMIEARPLGLPADPFLIVIKQGSVHEARTAWRTNHRCGLEFLSSWRFDGEAPEAMRQLWSALLPR